MRKLKTSDYKAPTREIEDDFVPFGQLRDYNTVDDLDGSVPRQFHLKGKHNQRTHGGNASHVPDVTDTVKTKTGTVQGVATDYQDYGGSGWLKLDVADKKKWHKLDDLEVVAKGAGIGNESGHTSKPIPTPGSTKEKVKLPHGEFDVTERMRQGGEDWVKIDTTAKKKWYKQSELEGGHEPGVPTPPKAPTPTPVVKLQSTAAPKMYSSPEVDKLHAKVTEITSRLDEHQKTYPGHEEWHAAFLAAGSPEYAAPAYKKINADFDTRRAAFEVVKKKTEREYSDAVDARNAQIAKETGRPVVTRAMISAHLGPLRDWQNETFEALNQFEKSAEEHTLATGRTTTYQKMEYFAGKPGPTIRHEDGLGMEQRQKYLAPPPGHDPTTGTPAKYATWASSRAEIDAMYRARDRGMTLDEYHAALDVKAKALIGNALATGGVYTRIMPASIPKIAASGKMLTQHELQPNKESSAVRKQAELLLFGAESTESHPIYGYVSSSPTARVTKNSIGGGRKKIASETTGDLDWLDGYGSVAMKVKPEVYSHTTVTHGDTIDMVMKRSMTTAHPISDPRSTMFDNGVNGINHREKTMFSRTHNPLDYDDVDGRMANMVSSWGAKGYVEAQFHRALTLHDFSEAITPKPLPPASRKILEAAGIKITVVPTE